MNNIILYANAVVWSLTFLYWWKRRGAISVGSVIIFLYALISIASCHQFINPETRSFYSNTIYIIPLLYLYIVLYSLIRPLFLIDYSKIREIKLPSIKIINPICTFIVICSVFQLLTGLEDISQGFKLMLIDNSNAIEAYLQTTEANMTRTALTGSFNVVGFLVTTGMNFSMLFFFLYLLYPNRNNKILIGLIISVVANPIMSVASGSREKVITTILLFLLMFFLLRPFIDERFRRRISVFSISMFGFLLTFFVVISLARAQGDIEQLFTGFETYFGMSFLNFDQKCFYANGTREGNLVSPLLNVLLGGQTFSQELLRDKYASLGVDNGIFYTFVGDFVLDYGPLLSFLILIAIAVISRNVYKHNSWTAGHVVFSFILLKLLSGFYLHQFSGIGGNLFIIELFILYALFSNRKSNKMIDVVTVKF